MGKNFMMDGSNLNQIRNETYDFILSAHNLEHYANPLKAIREWKRVLKKGGYMVVTTPDKKRMFDRNRPYTAMDHLISDYLENVHEDSLSHLQEIANLHDFSLDRGLVPVGSESLKETFVKRSMQNNELRALHHHVFDMGTLKCIGRYFGMETIREHWDWDMHQTIIWKKL